MKKTFKTLFFVMIGLLALSSCEDVPAPYNLPEKSSNSGNQEEGGNEGTAVTCTKAVELVNAMEDGATSAETYSITGYITEVVSEVSRNQQSFWIADTKSGGKVFQAYWANLPEGVTEFKVGSKVKITGQLMKYVKDGKVTPEIKNAVVAILEDGEGGGDDGGSTEGIAVTCAQAVELVNALADGAISAETYSITGYITEVVSEVSRNQQSFWIADTKSGGKVFQAYWANLPEGVTEFKAGSKVKITGQLMKYVKEGVVTPEIKNATVVILEQGEGGGDDGGSTEGTALTCAEAVELVNALADGATSAETYTITGYITEVISAVSRNQQSFWIADTKSGGKVFQAYWANLPEGVTEFKVGSKVKITGQLMKYVKDGKVTPEIKNATVVILEDGEGGGGEDQGGGETVTTLVNGNFESWVSDAEPTGWKSKSTASSATLSKNTDAHGGSYSCKVAPVASKNVRLATKEITLEAGSYTFSCYAKATTTDASQTRIGYVPMKSDGSVGTYMYGDYATLNNSEWTLVSYSFELTEETTLCLLVMNPKNSTYAVSQDILVDDATLTKK